MESKTLLPPCLIWSRIQLHCNQFPRAGCAFYCRTSCRGDILENDSIPSRIVEPSIPGGFPVFLPPRPLGSFLTTNPLRLLPFADFAITIPVKGTAPNSRPPTASTHLIHPIFDGSLYLSDERIQDSSLLVSCRKNEDFPPWQV